jgi:hypothetical protein
MAGGVMGSGPDPSQPAWAAPAPWPLPSSNLNPGQDTREQTTKRTDDGTNPLPSCVALRGLLVREVPSASLSPSDSHRYTPRVATLGGRSLGVAPRPTCGVMRESATHATSITLIAVCTRTNAQASKPSLLSTRLSPTSHASLTAAHRRSLRPPPSETPPQ